MCFHPLGSPPEAATRNSPPEDGIGGELDLASLLRRERGQQLVQLVSKQSGRWGALGDLPKLQMVEDLADDFRLFDEGDDFHRRQATRTSEGVDFIDPAQ